MLQLLADNNELEANRQPLKIYDSYINDNEINKQNVIQFRVLPFPDF